MNTHILPISALVALIAMGAPSQAADDYQVEQEHWYDGTTSEWIDSDPGGPMHLQWSPLPPGGHALAGRYPSQGAPFPETDAFIADTLSSDGRFTGNYWEGGLIPRTLSFKFYAADVIPSSLLLRIVGRDGGVTNSFFTSLTSQLVERETWTYLSVPLQYESGIWNGGAGQAFTNTLADVQWIEIRVTRSGELGQSYYIDDFALTRLVPSALAMVDSDGDGLPDFWEEQYFGGATNGVASADGDGDGDSNLQEYNGQSDPTAGQSYVRVEGLQRPMNWELSFEGELGREYRVETASAPWAEPWSEVAGPFSGIGTLMSVSFTNDTQDSWFRIRAQRP